MKKKLNNKGFTLVELLAVIIVLAVILVLVVPTVLTQMNSAKKRSFSMYGQRVLSNAQTIYQTYSLMGGELPTGLVRGTGTNAGKFCISIKNLGMANTGSYDGYVIITGPNAMNTESVATYEIYMSDQTDYVYNGTLGTELTVNNISGLATNALNTTEAAKYSGCYTAPSASSASSAS